MQTVWMAVTKDKYEYPIAVADTADELAAMIGKKASTIRTIVSRGKHGQLPGKQRYFKIETEELADDA